MEHIPIEGAISIARLTEQGGLPSDKLLRICRLAASAGILREIEEGVFAHTAISVKLVRDTGFRSFIAFQYVTTRFGECEVEFHLANFFLFTDSTKRGLQALIWLIRYGRKIPFGLGSQHLNMRKCSIFVLLSINCSA